VIVSRQRRFTLATAAKIAVAAAIVTTVTWCVVRYNRRANQNGDAWLADATADARGWASDAELIELEGHGVAADGSTPMLESFQVTWRYVFRSPSRLGGSSKLPATIPGAPAPERAPGCYGFTVSLSQTSRGRLSAAGSPMACPAGAGLGGPTRCSIVQVWQRAIARNAPNPAYAAMQLRSSNGAREWHFEVTDRSTNTTMFAANFPDDC
jgi:hypothetical protein